MFRWILPLLLAVALTAITASAASLTVDGGTLQTFTEAVDIDIPTTPGGVDCDINWHRHPNARLEWEPVAGAEGYEIEHRGPFSSGYHDLASVGGETTTLTLKPSFLKHQYRVSAIVDGSPGEPAESPRVHCKPKHTYHLGGPLHGSEHHSVRYATLDWPDDDVSAGYVVLRSTVAGGPYEIVGAPIDSDFVDSPIEDGVTFYYRVVGIDPSGMESEPSNEIEIIDQSLPPSDNEVTPVDGADDAGGDGAAADEVLEEQADQAQPADGGAAADDGVASEEADAEPAGDASLDGDPPAEDGPADAEPAGAGAEDPEAVATPADP